MEEIIKDKPEDTGPIYFFDQFKPKRKIWEKETNEEQFSHLMAKYGHKNRKSKELKKAELSAATSSEKNAFQSIDISKPPSASKPPLNIKFSKTHLQKDLLEEYMLTAPGILSELETILQKYAEDHITFPVGIVNLMNYSWQDLTEGTFKCAPKCSMLRQPKALQGESSSVTMVDSKEQKISSDSREEFNKENCVVKAKNGQRVTSLKSMERISSISHIQDSQISQEESLPVVLHSSLSSKVCLENDSPPLDWGDAEESAGPHGWIFQHPYSKLEILEWTNILGTAVERLQAAITEIKREEAKLKKEGFNKQLILSHYNEPESEEKSQGAQGSQSFWLELLERRPQMPIIRKANPEMKKFHYALVDGSSLTYYPSGRLAVCQSYSDLPWGGIYTNIFSDVPDPVVLGTFTPSGCGSISFPKRKIIAMMFNLDGGIVTNKSGKIIREWTWPSKGKLDDPVEIWVNKFITVKISGRFAITLSYKWHPQSVTLSLAPIKCKPDSPGCPDTSLPEINPDSREAWGLPGKGTQLGLTTQNKDASGLADPENMDTADPAMDIGPMLDIAAAIQLRKLQRKVKHIFLHWLNHYRCALGMEPLLTCKISKFPQEVARKPKVLLVNVPLRQDAKDENKDKEYLRYRNTFLMLKGLFNPSPLRRIQRTPASNQSFGLPLLIESKDAWFTSQLVCPVVLRRTLCGKERDTCRCSSHSIPEVTDLEYDQLISNQLSSVDQIVIVYVFSAKEKDRIIKEVVKIYRELNRSRSMPCIQNRLDSFRLLKYNIISASKFTASNCPLLVRRHNVIPGVFLMYIRGKLLFANFIFNGYGTSAKDLHKQIVKTRNDYHRGYFLPSDFRIRT